jgi:hypothetical protein
VHEDVEAGIDPRKLGTVPLAEKERAAKGAARGVLGRPRPDDHQPDPGQRRHTAEQVESLLGGQPPDIADDDLTRWRQFAAQPLAAPGWIEPGRVDAPAPHVDPAESAVEQRGRGRRRGRERAVRSVVDPAQPPPACTLASAAEVVGAGICRQVGGVHGDCLQAQPPRGG